MSAQPGRKVRGCCCGIPIRVGVAILAWLYFLRGILVVFLAVLILKRDTSAMETGVKALVIALGSLSALLVVTSALGVIATIGQYPRVARIWSILFQIWYYLQLALDITVVALFFAKKLDSLIPECISLSSNARPTSSAYRNCDRARNRLSLYYTLSGVVRSAIGYFFTRRVSSFSRHCAERAATNHNLAVPAQTTTLSGSTHNQKNSLNIQGEYQTPYQASADSLQGAKTV
ncbi:hypothetical protein OPQ81_007872 [Rhizoctonia solani]|nr:hypothetical protein OPQ81_007872 [Rhizoctonia solani]